MAYSEGLRVLLVDDDESFVNVLGSQLKDEYGFEISIVGGGEEAIDLLLKEHRGFDVILLDYLMPGVTGLQMLQWMHEHEKRTPVIMLTAAGSEQVAVEAMKLGAYDYMRKELIELQHLALAIKATHERHLFRVSREIEEERAREIVLNGQATDKTRDVINAITPSLNTALANIDAEIETNLEEAIKSLAKEEQRKARVVIEELRRQLKIVETGIQGLLSLYQLVHAHHAEVEDIHHIKREFEERMKKTVVLTHHRETKSV